MSKTKKKTGRPPKAIKKEVRASARFTRAEYFIVREKARQAGVNISGYIRQLTIQGGIIPRLTAAERQDVRDLVGMANNVNQMAKCCHQEGVLKGARYFEQLLVQLDTVLKKFKS